jgi:hypothetical protein
MFIAFAGESIESTEKSPPDAARDAVVIGSFFEKDQSFPWFRGIVSLLDNGCI